MKNCIKYNILFLCILSCNAYCQYNITGDFPYLAGQKISLMGFEGFEIYTIDSTKVTEKGNFQLNYTSKDRGMGYLVAENNKAYFVVLDNENIQLKGEVLSAPESIEILAGKENQLFVQYAKETTKREQVLSAWIYLQKIYRADPLFSKQESPLKDIETEMKRIRQEDEIFLKNLDPKSYISWYLPVRKLVSSVATIAQYRTEEIPATITAFRNMDYSDLRLFKNGLLKDAIESHYWLIENMGQPLDTVFKEMNISTDYLIENLSTDEIKFNLITRYLFNLLESHSLFQASEYLAIKVLTQDACKVNEDLAKQLETYRIMKKGNIAPNIAFEGNLFKNGKLVSSDAHLSDFDSDYKVVIFGASWCPDCVEQLSQVPILYEKWKSKGVEVVFISLDTDETVFKNFTSIFPFVSFCDYKKWGTQSVKDYYVFVTPAMFLLGKDEEIVLRPNSVKQIDAWIDFYIGS